MNNLQPIHARPRSARLRRRAVAAIVLASCILLPAAPAATADDTRVTAAAAGETPAEAPRLRELQRELSRLIQLGRDRVFPALVHIQVVTVFYSGGQEVKRNAVGSGTIITAEGHVLTNQHVTDDGRSFRCTLADKQEVGCTLVGEDPLTDLAVLRLHLDELAGEPVPPGIAVFGDSSGLEVGDYVLAMGSPFALSRSVTLGIVSNSERVFSGGPGGGDVMQLEAGQRTGLFTRWIQHDALINPGNSGGPLVNLAGEVIGVNELGGSAMGFAIPADLARRVADDLIAHGEVPRSWIGASLRPVDRTGYERGVLVESVVVGGPADAAGLAPGDLLLRLADEPVTVRYAEQLPPLLKTLAELPLGEPVEVVYERDGAETPASLVTTRLERDLGDQASFRAWGFSGMEITDKMARDRRLEGADGLLVTGVRGGGPAQLAEPPLAAGDVVRRVAGRPVAALTDLAAVYDELYRADGEEPQELLVGFDRGGQSFLTLLEPRADDDRERPRELPKAWLGVATQPLVRRLAEHLGDPAAQGYRVTRVYPGTEADAAGLAVGDVIVALEGEPVVPAGIEDSGLLARRVRRLPIGETAALTVLRNGERLTVPVALERTRPGPSEARRDRDREFELVVREITFFDRDDNRWGPDVEGVIVDQLEPAGWSGLGGLRPGDLIQRWDGERIADLGSFRRALAASTEARAERVEVVVLRGVRTRFLFVEPEWSPLPATETAGSGDDADEIGGA